MITKGKEVLRDRHLEVAICITAGFCVLAYLGAFFLRFDFGRIPDEHLPAMWAGLPLLVALRMATLMAFRVHRGLYRFSSLYDFVQLFKAISLGSILFVVIWQLAIGYHYVMPRSIYLLDWILCMAFLMGLRIVVRLWRSRYRTRPRLQHDSEVSRALIVGAGSLGESILRIVDRRFLGQDFHVVGFVDQNRIKQGFAIHGIPVLGDPERVPALVEEHEVDTILFAIREPHPGLFAGIVNSCAGLEVKFKTVSVLKDAFTGDVSIDQVRELKIEDLLGREPVDLDPTPVREALLGQTVLVTGAGGSIGSELCRQIASFAPKQLILFDMDETPLFEIDMELRRLYPGLDIQPFVGDVKHADVIERVFSMFKPGFVYHAAAYKHVPLMESHPDEAVLNNIRGTRQLAEAARRHGCQRFVMISTDKAVRPTNVMGATKRMCERVVHSMKGGDTVFVAVRFGNVLGSNGSVIPVFKKQIEAGGPITVTDPEMTRYFMTIPEAVSLVLQCGIIAEPENIFVLDMGTPVKIMDLARNMIRLSGLHENEDISIEVTGLRPGEKMYEELVAYGESLQATDVPKVNVLTKEVQRMDCAVLSTLIYRLEELAQARRVEEVRALLWHLIELDAKRNQREWSDCSEGCVNGAPEKRAEEAPPAGDPSISKGRVLAVVSNLGEEELLREGLLGAGYELDCLDSCEGAVNLLISDRAYVAVLCDVLLPSCTVWELRDRLHDLGFNLPVVAMSACDGKGTNPLKELDPSIPVVCKPFHAKEFEAACAGALKPPNSAIR